MPLRVAQGISNRPMPVHLLPGQAGGDAVGEGLAATEGGPSGGGAGIGARSQAESAAAKAGRPGHLSQLHSPAESTTLRIQALQRCSRQRRQPNVAP